MMPDRTDRAPAPYSPPPACWPAEAPAVYVLDLREREPWRPWLGLWFALAAAGVVLLALLGRWLR